MSLRDLSTCTSMVIFISSNFRRSNLPPAGPNIGRFLDAKIKILKKKNKKGLLQTEKNNVQFKIKIRKIPKFLTATVLQIVADGCAFLVSLLPM